MVRSSHIHRSTGTTRTAQHCLPMNRVNKFHSVYLRLKLLSFVGQHNSFVYHESRHNINYVSISYMSTLYQINSNSPRRRVGWLLNRLLFNNSIVCQSNWISHDHNNSVTRSDVFNTFLEYRGTPKLLQTSKLSQILYQHIWRIRILSFQHFQPSFNDVTIVVTGDDPSHK